MSESHIVINKENFARIKRMLEKLYVETLARVTFLIDRDGQPIAFHGEIGDMDMTSFSSLAAGNVAATSSMAKLIGEEEFPAVVHEGERESIFISVIGRSLLGVVFDERSTPGLVKLRTKKASFEVASILKDIEDSSNNHAQMGKSFFSEVTEDDIDSLFS